MTETAKKNSIETLRGMQRGGDLPGLLAYCAEENLGDDTEAVLLEGLARLLSGDGQGRERLQEVVKVPPANDAWQSDLGLARFLLGHLDQAESLLGELVETGHADAVTFGRWAALRLVRGDLDGARAAYQEAVFREPGRAEWHNNLAGIQVRQQKLEEALENYDIALSLKPDLEQAQQSRQRVLVALERTEDLVAELQQALEKDPEDSNLRLRLARAYNLDNRPAEAVKVLRRALVPVDEIEKPEADQESRAVEGVFSEAGTGEGPAAAGGGKTSAAADRYNAQFGYRLLLAEIFSGRAMHAKALVALKQLEKMDPDNPVPVVCRQVQTLMELRNYDSAREKLAALEADWPDNNQLKTIRANLLCETGEYEEAEQLLRGLLETYPGDAGLLAQLGQTLLWVGDLEEAAECFEKASEINPMALAQMVNARKIPDDPAALEKMRILADNPLLADVARQNMNFALSTVYDRQKDFDTAFYYLDQANRLANKGLNYDPDAFSQRCRAMARVFSRDFLGSLKPIRGSDRTPVFVVGMPRSGTTLTEQILSSHPDIFGAGELPIIPRLTGLMPKVLKVKKKYPWCVYHMNPHLREEAARHYLYNLYEYDSEHPYVVDKMPHNFVNLGLIAMIFPKARIIHVNRDPRDNAVSNYQQNFKMRHGGMGFAFNLEHIARQINDYHRLMDHWRKVLPLPIFDLSYEAMVEDMAGTAAELLDFVGVGWHEEVTRFYETKRAVRTASVSQVRQPIYKTSMKKWKRYEKHLGDLLDHLDPEVVARYDAPAADNNPYENRIVRPGGRDRGNLPPLAEGDKG